jgi:hypothetical protein
MTLANGSRIISLPGDEKTIRGYSGVKLLVIDEAARVPDELYYSVRPMLAVSGGRLAALSTPFGKQGWFYKEWHNGSGWQRVRITAEECPRIPREFLEQEKRSLGADWYAQEYGCVFIDACGAPQLRALAISPKGDVIAVGTRSGMVRLYDVATRQQVAVLSGHMGVGGMAFSPDGLRIVTGGESLRLWEAKTGRAILTVGHHPPGISSVAFSPDGWKILTSNNQDVRIWDATPLKK